MKCLCDKSSARETNINNIPVAICPCGIIRQTDLPFADVHSCLKYYKQDYEVGKLHSYKHDKKIAKRRLQRYNFEEGTFLLDVGSGNNAFVDECRQNNINAVGCELKKDNKNKFVYNNSIEDINFPTDYFDVITCHDMLEHVFNPLVILKEIFRSLKQGGLFILDFPHFFSDAGKHHWRKVEHIWFLNREQIVKILNQQGFIIYDICIPIPSKIIFYLHKPRLNRPKILVPPGIGDSYWSLVKLESYLKREELSLPDIYVFCDKDKQGTRHTRSFDFLEMFPFIRSMKKNKWDPELRSIWEKVYLQDGKSIFKNILGCDLIAYNGILRFGRSLEQVDNLKCNWYPKMFISLKQKQFQKQCKNKWGRYVILYFINGGMYRKWLAEFGIQKIIIGLREFAKITGYRLILAGGDWDEQDNIIQVLSKDLSAINMVGKTDLHELFGMIKGSQGVIGFPSGLTIMATVFHKKTFMLWNDYFHKNFFWNACPPDVKNKTYKIANTKQLFPSEFMGGLQTLFQRDRKVMQMQLSEQAPPPPPPKTTVSCVLKSGGDYDIDYVLKLKNSILRNTTIPLRFICLTDIDINPEVCETIKLEKNEKGWWSKIELFKKNKIDTDQIIYFDLDTVILDNIDDIVFYFYDFCALRPWNYENQKRGLYASGMMAWKNNGYNYLFDNFDTDKTKLYPRGDQEYFSKVLQKEKQKVDFFQNLFSGIYSYKRNCGQGLPSDARIVCFHGKPRPNDVHDQWVKDNWK